MLVSSRTADCSGSVAPDWVTMMQRGFPFLEIVKPAWREGVIVRNAAVRRENRLNLAVNIRGIFELEARGCKRVWPDQGGWFHFLTTKAQRHRDVND